MREEELKREAQKRRTIPEQSWAYLDDRGYVGEALERPFDEEKVEYLIKEFDSLADASPAARSRAKPEGRAKEIPVTVSLRPEEAERARAFEEYLDYAANFDQDLHRFRERVLGNDLLTAEQARAFVQSPAARF